MKSVAQFRRATEKLLFNLFGGEELASVSLPMPDVEKFSGYLPYRSYDRDTELFYNDASCGFVLEIAPLTGADERVHQSLNQIFSDILMPGCDFHVVSYASPRISKIVQEWCYPRYLAGDVFEKIANYRAGHLARGAWKSMAADGPFITRNFRTVFSVSIKQGSKVSKRDLLTIRESLVAHFAAIGTPSRAFTPIELMQFCDEITTPSTGTGDDPLHYSDLDPINVQCIRPDFEIAIERDRILTRSQSLRMTGRTLHDGVPELGIFTPSSFDVRALVVKNYPERFAAWDGQQLIGSIFNPKLNFGCPVAMVFQGRVLDDTESSTRAGLKHVRSKQLADGKAVGLIPHLARQAAEWENVASLVRIGHRLVKGFYNINVISPRESAEENLRTAKAVFKAAGWDLSDQLHINIMSYCSMFPMNISSGLGDMLTRMKMQRTMVTTNAASFAPMHGEFLGGNIPHMMLIGRRGQPLYWSPFQNNEGNHNTAIFGKSGSGKSVFLQELCTSLVGSGAHAIIIDDGRSFEHTCKALGGRFIEFTLSSGLSVNPFRMIDAEQAAADEDYQVDCLAMLMSIIGQMARHEQRLNDFEKGIIDRAVNQVWNDMGSDGTIDAVIEALVSDDDPVGQQIATSLNQFSSTGTYGRFFVGDSIIDLTNPFTVFELSDLASREDLRSAVLTSIMFLASQYMRKSDRTIPKALFIDEAWQLLKGGSMAQFVEIYARTCRKYYGSLITATQSINDYYKSDGSRAALENSDWSVVLAQKPETIGELSRMGRFELNEFTNALIRSLKRQGTDYSDVFVRGPDTEFVARLVLDKFSAALFSSSPKVFAEIEALHHRGLSMADAIETVAFPENAKFGGEILAAAE
jgi:conjugal transfer ATP-binding protein TraC